MIQNETGAPYGAAYNATANPDNGYLQKETVDNITNLATATASDSADIAQLTSTVTRLTTELTTVNKKLVITLKEKRARQDSRRGRNINTCKRGDGSGAEDLTGSGAGAAARTGASAPTIAEAKDPEPPIHYCWMCGPGCRQNSAKRPNPLANHIYMTTRRDMQGWAKGPQ